MNIFQYPQQYYAYFSRYYGSRDHTEDVHVLMFGDYITEEAYLLSRARWFGYKLLAGTYI